VTESGGELASRLLIGLAEEVATLRVAHQHQVTEAGQHGTGDLTGEGPAILPEAILGAQQDRAAAEHVADRDQVGKRRQHRHLGPRRLAASRLPRHRASNTTTSAVRYPGRRDSQGLGSVGLTAVAGLIGRFWPVVGLTSRAWPSGARRRVCVGFGQGNGR